MPSKVVHFEIPADNVERAKTFYKKAFGWQIDQFPAEYQSKEELPSLHRGMYIEPGAIKGELTKREDPVEHTVITIAVDDIDSALWNIEENGGQIVQNVRAILGKGFVAYIKDTEGNTIGVWQWAHETFATFRRRSMSEIFFADPGLTNRKLTRGTYSEENFLSVFLG